MQNNIFFNENKNLFEFFLNDKLYIGIIIVDPNYKILYCNNKFQKITGFSFDNIKNSNIKDIFPELYSKILTNDNFNEFNFNNIKTNKIKNLSFNIFSDNKISDNKIILINDISAKKAKDEIFKFALYFLDNTETIAIACDIKGNIVFTNKEALKKLKFENIELLEMNIKDIVKKNNQNIIDTQLEFALNGRSLSQELTLVTKFGDYIDVIFNSKLINELNEKIIFFIANDITLSKKINKKIEDSSKMDSIISLAGGIAHDFNNLLTIIQGNAQLLELKLQDEEKLLNRVKNITETTKKATELTHALLSFSKIKNSDIIPLSIKQIAKDILKIFKNETLKNYDLTIDVPISIPIIMGNENIVTQCLKRLYNNSINSMPNGGKINIKVSEEKLSNLEQKKLHVFTKHFIKVSIKDNREFKYKIENEKVITKAETTQGMNDQSGIDISIVYQLITSINGIISFLTDEEKNMIYNIYFPVISLDDHEKNLSINYKKNIKKDHILIVDDQIIILDLIKEAFSSSNFNILFAKNGKEAIEQLKKYKNKIFLSIIDYYLPDISFDELVEKIHETNKNIKIILMSGQINVSDTNYDIYGKIQKPFKITNLLNMVNNIDT